MLKFNKGKLSPPSLGQAPAQPTPVQQAPVEACKHPALVSVGDRDMCQVCRKTLN